MILRLRRRRRISLGKPVRGGHRPEPGRGIVFRYTIFFLKFFFGKQVYSFPLNNNIVKVSLLYFGMNIHKIAR